MRIPSAGLLQLTVFLVSAWFGSSAYAGELSRLEIHTKEQTVVFRVELARTAEERARGLMFRRSMEADRGMLFGFDHDQHVGMWMKNTFIPLDMLFISARGEIRKIVKRTVPKSLAPISSGEPIRAVLELNGGTTDKLKIRPGDRVIHSMFDNAGN